MNKSMVGLCLVLFVLASCSTVTEIPSTPTPLPLPQSAWGTVQIIGQGQQLDAPIILPFQAGNLYTWTGADAVEARHYAYGIAGNSQIIALRAYYPFSQSLFPVGNKALLLWLDRTTERETLFLQSALLSPDGIAEVGAIQVSEIPTHRYSAIGTDFIRVVWSGGEGAVSNLYIHEIDSQSRPYGFALLRRDADFPALVRDQSSIDTLYWLENQDRHIQWANFDETGITLALAESHLLAQTTHLNANNTLETFFVVHDATHRYLFWNVRDLDNRHQVWFSTGRLDENTITTPSVWMPAGDTTQTVTTSFNRGTVYAGTTGNIPAQWAYPLPLSSTIIPVAVNMGSTLGVAYLQAGTLLGYETVVQAVQSSGLPYITTDSARNLYLSWSELAQPSALMLFTKTGD